MADRKILIQINADGTAAVRNIRDVSGETKKMGDASESAGKRIASAWRQIGAVVGTAAIGRAFLDAAIAADRLEKSLIAVTRSTVATSREMTYIRDVANRLGLEVQSASVAYLSLTAASKGTRLEGEYARNIFEAVSLAMGKLGKSSADTEGALLAVEQMISKGNVQAEELRGQLGERLPGAFQAAATAMGVTTAELDKLLSTGQVTAEDLLPKLADRLNELYDDGNQISNITAEWNRMTGAFQGLAVAIDSAIGLTDALQSALRVASGSIDNIRWAIEYLDTGSNPDAAPFAIASRDLGYESLRQEADKLYSEIIKKQTEIYRLSEQLDKAGWFGSSNVRRELEVSQAQLLEMAQRLGDVKAVIADLDAQQESTWKRQAEGAREAAAAAKDYGEVLTGEAKIVADLEQQYGLLRGQLDAVWKLESGRGKTAGVDSSQMVRDLASTKGAMTEIVGEFQMARATAQGLNADLSSFNGQAEAAAKYLAEAAAKGLTLWEQFAYYHGGPNRAAWGERTRAYADEAVKIVQQANGAMVSIGSSTAQAIDNGQAALARALGQAIQKSEQLARAHLDGYADAQDYAEAQRALEVAVAAGARTQKEASVILESMRAKTNEAVNDTREGADVWSAVWESAVSRVDDAFAGLWVDLFEGTRSTLDSLKKGIMRWLAEVAHMLTTQRLTVAIGASMGLPGMANAGGAASAASSGGGLSSMISGLGSWFGGSSIGTSLATLAIGQQGLMIAQQNVGLGVNSLLQSGAANLAATSNLALGIGGIGGMLAGSLLGNGSTESQLGSAAGSVAGSVIGSMLMPGVGTILGGILGGGGGGFLGGLFGGKKDKPNPWAAIDVAGGNLRLLNSNEMDSGAIRQALDQVNREMDAVAQALGDAAVNWRKFYNHTSWHLTSGESIDSMIQNVANWQISHMISAMRSSEVAKAGSALMGEMIQAIVKEAGYNPQAAVAGVQVAKALYRNLRLAVDQLVVFTADQSLFSSIDAASETLWELSRSMQKAGESTADALARILNAFSAATLTARLNPGFDGLQVNQSVIDQITRDQFRYLDEDVAKAEAELVAALAGRRVLESGSYTVQQFAGYDYGSGISPPPARYEDVVYQYSYWTNKIFPAEIEAARERLEHARELAGITERVLTEEELQAELMRKRIEIMDSITDLAGGAEELAALQLAYYDAAFSEQERAQQALGFGRGKLDDFNAGLGLVGESAIRSLASLRSYIEGLDLSTDAGQSAYVEGLRQVQWFTAIEEALKALNPELGNLEDGLKGTLGVIQGALRQAEQVRGVSEFERAMALRDLQRMGRGPGLPAQADLERTLGILSRVQDQDFSTAAERDLMRAQAYANLLKMEQLGTIQTDPVAAAVALLRDDADSQHREAYAEMTQQTDRLDAIISTIGAALNVAPGADHATQLIAELRALRADLTEIGAQQILPARDIRDLLRRWEIDGLPSPRDEDGESVTLLRVA